MLLALINKSGSILVGSSELGYPQFSALLEYGEKALVNPPS